jgi:Mce-associated membrane protein
MPVRTTKDADTDEKSAVDEEQPETGDEMVDDDSEKNEAATEPDSEEPGAPGWRRRILIGAVALLLVAALAASGFFGWQLWRERQVVRAGEDAQRAAVAYAQILTSIDSNKVDENFNQVLDGATGEFKDMYTQSSTQLRQLLIDNKASAHGVVLESAVQSATRDKVVVLLFVDQSVSNTTVPDARIDRSRIKMTMEYVDGRWRAAKVELP